MSTKGALVFLPSSASSAVDLEVTIKDLNGNHYLGQMEGEDLVATDANMYFFPSGMKVAGDPLQNVDNDLKSFHSFMSGNFAYLKSVKDTSEVLKPLNDDHLKQICYLRFMTVKHGLVSPLFKPENFHVNYSECFPLNLEEMSRMTAPDANISEEDIRNSQAIMKQMSKQDISMLKTKQSEYNKYARIFTDLVCLLAYVFRARAHHYTPALQEVYERVWKKCRIEVAGDILPFNVIMTCAFHAIYPLVLDNFWIQSSENGRVNGALIKRINCAPSGSAGPYVLEQGLMDMELIAPGIRSVMKEATKKLDDVLIELRKHRFNGSVNARYYGAKRMAIDEKSLGAIAATIYAALSKLTENAPLAKSPALKRISDNAPITGNVFANTIQSIARRPETVNKLLLIDFPVPNT